jgi:hypothetical protein
VVFLSLEDETGPLNVIVWAAARLPEVDRAEWFSLITRQEPFCDVVTIALAECRIKQ